jgi:hypothetical protein
MATETEAPSQVARATWWSVAVLALVAVVIRLPLFFSGRSLVFDDGQYGVSVVDMRHGYAPYAGVFSSQGPLHYPLLYVGDLLGLRTLDAPRVTPVLAGVAATIGVWLIARRLGSTPGVALVAGLLVATTGTMLWTTGQVTGDGIAMAIMVWAVWAAVFYRDRPSVARVALVGVLVGCALAVKPLVGAALIPIAWWMWSSRRWRDILVALGTAAVVWLATAVPWGLGRVYEQSIAYHLGKGPEYSKPFQLGKLTSLLVLRDGIVVAAVALGLIAIIVVGVAALHTRTDDAVIIGVWIVAAALVCIFEKALFANHLVTVVIPLALLFAVRPPPLRWLAWSLVILVPWAVFNLSDMLWPGPYHGAEAALMRDLQALPSNAQAISDDPQYVWRAGLHTPRMMNDVSKMRIDQRNLTTAKVVAAAGEPQTCAVVIWTFRFGSLLPGLREGLQSEGYTKAREYAPYRELWLRPPCLAS